MHVFERKEMIVGFFVLIVREPVKCFTLRETRILGLLTTTM